MVTDTGLIAMRYAPAPALFDLSGEVARNRRTRIHGRIAVMDGEIAREEERSLTLRRRLGAVPDLRRFVIVEACTGARARGVVVRRSYDTSGRDELVTTRIAADRVRITRTGCFRARYQCPVRTTASTGCAFGPNATQKPDAHPQPGHVITRHQKGFHVERRLDTRPIPLRALGISEMLELTGFRSDFRSDGTKFLSGVGRALKLV